MTDRRLAVALFVLSFAAYTFFFGGEGWNQNSHFALTRALVERGTLHIDEFARTTGDVSTGAGGRTYSNKAPGLSFLAALPYAAFFAVERWAGLWPADLATLNQRLVTIAVCAVSGALVGVLLFLHGRRLGIDRLPAMTAALAMLFGTILFPYSTVLMAHVPAAFFLLLAFVLARSRPLVSGIAAGVATSCFYVCAGGAAVLLVSIWKRDSWRAAARFAAGGLPFAILLAAYHTVCFGSPWRTAVEASTFTSQGLLFGVLAIPTVEGLWGLTFSPYRGLFYTSPVLLLALAGLWRRLDLAATSLIFLLVIAGFNFWHGGWAFGPRYLLPVVPLFGMALLLVAGRWRPLWLILGVVSFVFNFAAAAVNPTPDESIRDPLRQELLPAIVRGDVAHPTRAANLGEPIFGKGSRASVLPALIWIAAGSAIVLRRARAAPSDIFSAHDREGRRVR